jgi:hypothetical protein
MEEAPLPSRPLWRRFEPRRSCATPLWVWLDLDCAQRIATALLLLNLKSILFCPFDQCVQLSHLEIKRNANTFVTSLFELDSGDGREGL